MINAAGRSEIEVQGEKRGIDGAAGFALPAEIEAQREIGRQRESLLQDERAGIGSLASEGAELLGVGVDAPARSGIGQDAEARARAEGVTLLERVMRAHGGFRSCIEACSRPEQPGSAEAAVGGDRERLGAAAGERALPAEARRQERDWTNSSRGESEKISTGMKLSMRAPARS